MSDLSKHKMQPLSAVHQRHPSALPRPNPGDGFCLLIALGVFSFLPNPQSGMQALAAPPSFRTTALWGRLGWERVAQSELVGVLTLAVQS